jgi:hypothetical protein
MALVEHARQAVALLVGLDGAVGVHRVLPLVNTTTL